MCHHLILVCSGTFNIFKNLTSKLCDMAPPGFYAVRRGRKPGVYRTWDECSAQVNGFPCASFKKFRTEAEAVRFIKEIEPVASFTSVPTACSSTKRKRDELDFETIEKLFEDPSLNSMNIESVISAFSSPKEGPARNSISVPSSGRKKAYYAVHRGHKPGLYFTWTECEKQIRDFRNASYRKFENEEDALEYIRTGGIKKLSRRQAKNVEINEDFADAEDEYKELNLKDLKVDPDRVITVFTDGASSRNGRKGAAAGIGVYWGPNHPLNTSMRLTGRQTNNRAEIFAATHALRQAKQVGYKRIKLYTDSQFLIKGITDWINKWKKNGWKLANGDPVKNKDDFIELERAKEGLDVEFIYIKAHDNNPGNVEADRLAVQGARESVSDAFVCLT